MTPHENNRHTLWRTFLGVLLIAGTVAPWEASAQGPPPAATTSQDAVTDFEAQLATLNAEFRAAYAAARSALLKSEGPILLLAGDEIIVIRGNERKAIPYVPAEYHTLKAIAHVPLWAYVLLRDAVDHPFEPATAEAVQKFRTTVARTRDHLKPDAFPAGAAERQIWILDRSLALADRALAAQRLGRGELVVFCREVAPALWANLDLAANLELDALASAVDRIRAELGPDPWKRVRVVIEGAHTPRAGNLAMQYFHRVLGPGADDHRLVYAESAFDEEKALNVLGTVRQDLGVGEAFFADPDRMLRDLLADAATAWLDQRFGQQRSLSVASPSRHPAVRRCQRSCCCRRSR